MGLCHVLILIIVLFGTKLLSFCHFFVTFFSFSSIFLSFFSLFLSFPLSFLHSSHSLSFSSLSDYIHACSSAHKRLPTLSFLVINRPNDNKDDTINSSTSEVKEVANIQKMQVKGAAAVDPYVFIMLFYKLLVIYEHMYWWLMNIVCFICINNWHVLLCVYIHVLVTDMYCVMCFHTCIGY